MVKKMSMFFFAMFIVGLLAGCGLRRDVSRNATESLPSPSYSTISTTTANTSVGSSNAAETKMQIEDTLKTLEELEGVLESLDTVRTQDLLIP